MKQTITTFALAFLLATNFTLAPLAQAEVGGTITKSIETSSTTVNVESATTATTPSSDSSTIAGLLAQLSKLTTLFNELKAKMMGTKAEIKELRADIKTGMTDADIKTIQELLASDPTIYPRGLITGYYGPMTAEAIKRFQAKNNLEVTGEINEETRAALDSIIEERRANGKFPVGLLFSTSTKHKFEERLKNRCDDHVSATTTANHPCLRVKAKYNWWSDKKDEVKSELKDMKEKMKDKIKDKKDNASSSKMMADDSDDEEDDN